MKPIRRWPSDVRCSVAARPPAQLVAPMVGTSSAGPPAGSITTAGTFSRRSSAWWAGCSVGRHQDDAVGLAGPQVVQPLPGRRRVAVDGADHRADRGGVRDILDAADDLHRPRAVQVVEHQVDQARRVRRAGSLGAGSRAAASSASIRARVVGDTSDRPFSTRDTVGTETPASAAMTLIVTLRSLATVDPPVRNSETFGILLATHPGEARDQPPARHAGTARTPAVRSSAPPSSSPAR